MKQDKYQDSTVKTLLNTLDYAFDRASWHGPNLMSSLRGVKAADALRRLPGRKCLWEQALHAAYWKQMVLNKVIGTTPFPRRGSNWPKLPESPTAAAWNADIELLREIQLRLKAGVKALTPARLDEKLTRMIIGAALHDIYHAGQIRLLRKMLRTPTK